MAVLLDEVVNSGICYDTSQSREDEKVIARVDVVQRCVDSNFMSVRESYPKQLTLRFKSHIRDLTGEIGNTPTIKYPGTANSNPSGSQQATNMRRH